MLARIDNSTYAFIFELIQGFSLYYRSSYEVEGITEVPALNITAVSQVMIDSTNGVRYVGVQFEKKFEDWGLLQVLLKYNRTSKCSTFYGDGYLL